MMRKHQSASQANSDVLNGVMVALQILVLSVWVRVLVKQLTLISGWFTATYFFFLKCHLVKMIHIFCDVFATPYTDAVAKHIDSQSFATQEDSNRLIQD